MSFTQFKDIILPASLAIFAMFFGAGNLVFPLSLGAHNTHTPLFLLMTGFLLSGIGLPALGLITTALCKGNYKEILFLLGGRIGMVMATIIISLLGLFIANPRSCIVAYSSLVSYLPSMTGTPIVFNLLFFSGVYLAARYNSNVVHIIGKLLSPVKIAMIILVIVIGAYSGHLHQNKLTEHSHAFFHALNTGYHTLDMLASLFFGALIYQFVSQKANSHKLSNKSLMSYCIYSTLIGTSLLGIVYMGFLYIANLHATALQAADTATILNAANRLLFNSSTAIAFNICIAIACYVTSVALTSITSIFFYENIFNKKVNQSYCLIGTTIIAFGISNFSFAQLATIGGKVLGIIYPILVVLTLIKIVQKIRSLSASKTP